jgi:DNA-binding NarL/FixJ family response regulator
METHSEAGVGKMKRKAGPKVFRTVLVEDNAVLRGFVKEMLGIKFPTMTVFEAGDAKSATKIIDSSPPDLILMDIRLPDDSGLSLTKRIKQEHPEIAIMILTSYDLPEYREAAAESGAMCFVYKGIASGEQIADIIRSRFPELETKTNKE